MNASLRYSAPPTLRMLTCGSVAVGKAVDHDRPLELLSEDGFVGSTEIAAPLNFGPVLLQVFDCGIVAHTGKRRPHGFEFRDVAFQNLQFLAAFVEDAADQVHDHFLSHSLDFVEVRVSHFRLHHPEFREMAAGLRFLGAERRPETVNFAERHGRGFAVELAGLAQVSFVVVEVVRLRKA